MRYFILLLAIIVFSITAIAGKLNEGFVKDVDYLTAARGVQTATDELAKVKADPEVAKNAVTAKQEALDEANAALRLASIKAKQRVYSAYGDVLVARSKVEVADAKAKLADMQLKAVQLKLKAGAASAQDERQAKVASSRAKSALADEGRQLNLALAHLKIYGDEPPKEAALPSLPDEKLLTPTLHSEMLKALHVVAEAERALAMAQGPDTAPLEKAARERELAGAREAAQDKERVLREAIDVARKRFNLAGEQYSIAQDSVLLAEKSQQAMKAKHIAGAISDQALKEDEVSLLEARQALVAAEVEVWQAYYGVMIAIGGEA